MIITWTDRRREPKCSSDPRYPMGVDLDVSGGATPFCQISLPYPAERCGFYTIECEACGQKIAVTTAGRPDDPRSAKLACKGREAN